MVVKTNYKDIQTISFSICRLFRTGGPLKTMLICAVSWLNWNPLVKWQHKDLALIKEKRTEKGSTDCLSFQIACGKNELLGDGW